VYSSRRAPTPILGAMGYEFLAMLSSGAFYLSAALLTAAIVFSTRGALYSYMDAGAAAGAFAGLLTAAPCALLMSRDRRTGASEIIRTLPSARWQTLARLCVGVVAAIILTLVPLPAVIAVVALRGAMLTSAGVGSYFEVVLPSALIGAAVGALAGRAIRDVWLAVLTAVGTSGLLLWLASRGLSGLVPGPAGVFALGAAGPSAGPAWGSWPLSWPMLFQALCWTGFACLPAAALLTDFRRLRLWLTVAAMVGFATGVAGYSLATGGFAGPPTGGPPVAGWTITHMDVTMDIGRNTTATVEATVENNGDRAAPLPSLPLPAGLTAALPRPAVVPAHGTATIRLAYGGRWTQFGTVRNRGQIVRAAAVGHLLLSPASGWLPDPRAAYPITLQLLGTVPADTWCSLESTGVNRWAGLSTTPGASVGSFGRSRRDAPR